MYSLVLTCLSIYNKIKTIIIEQLQARIDRLNDVGPHVFDGIDNSFGFSTWKVGTIVLLK